MFGQSSLKENPSIGSQPTVTGDTLSERVIKTVLDENKDVSDAARLGRRKAMLRAVCAEFVGTVIYFVPIFGVLANNHTQGVGVFANRISTAAVSGMNVVCMIMCFSTLSGAIFNPAISFSLWITNKLSNRKCILFIITQMLASLMCMCIIWAGFPTVNVELWEALTLSPPSGASSWNVFFSEFICTFILTYAAFAMAFEEAESLKHSSMSVQAAQDSDGLVVFGSNPQSKVGFAPFALGFVVFSLSNFGGGSGPSMNPVRIFGPALLANKWDSFIFYMLGKK
ncbi:hypothetical protein EON63_03940 [archaeon]|nr:MAG: hypothetical protein EON63_03940 [archaeon]